MNPIFFFNREITPIRKLLMLHAVSGGGAGTEYTETGNPLTFLTDLARPLKSCLATWQPHQSGSGDPSPSNVRPVVGMDGVNVWHGRENQVDIDDKYKLAFHENYSNWSSENGTITITGNATGGYIMPCKPNEQYTYSFDTTYVGANMNVRVYEFEEYPTALSDGTLIVNVVSKDSKPPVSFATAENTHWLVVGFYAHHSENIIITNVMVNFGETASEYSPYHGTSYSVAFPATGKNLCKITASSNSASGMEWTVSNGVITVSGTPTGYAEINCGTADLPSEGDIVVSGISGTTNIVWANCNLLDADGVNVGTVGTAGTSTAFSFNMGNYPTAKTLNIKVKRSNNNVACSGDIKIQVEQGSSATAWEEYTNTVYGGTLDLTTGVLTAEYGLKIFTGEENYSWQTYGSNEVYTGDIVFPGIYKDGTSSIIYGISSAVVETNGKLSTSKISRNNRFDGEGVDFASLTTFWGLETVTIDSFKQMLNDLYDNGTPVTVAYKLDTPQTYQLSPTQITSLLGNNTMWADADELSVTYLKKG